MKKNLLNDCIKPFKGQATCTPDTTLGTAADLVSSSTEPIFVFESLIANGQGKKFLGVVSLYEALYERAFPLSTSVSSVFFVPAHLTAANTLFDAADEMRSHKLNTLPTFNVSGKIPTGIITAQSLVHTFLQTRYFPSALQLLEAEKVNTVPVHSFVKDAYHLLRDKTINEVIVTRADGSIAGVASRADVMRARMKPTRRQRFTSKGDSAKFPKEQFYEREPPSRDYNSIDRYYHLAVASRRIEKKGKEAHEKYIKELLRSPHSSIVLIDKSAKPKEIITYQAIITTISQSRPTHTVPLQFHDQRMRYSAIEKDRMLEVLEDFASKIDRKTPIDKVYASLEESKTMKGNPRAVQAVVKIVLKSGSVCTGKSTKHDTYESFRETLKNVNAEINRLQSRLHKQHPSKPSK